MITKDILIVMAKFFLKLETKIKEKKERLKKGEKYISWNYIFETRICSLYITKMKKHLGKTILQVWITF